ncbi:TIGR03960 family B12-binding radical SAM protein [bacterium]|nr:TIGR03960 family B12-binding radical SAM protein [bacterium]MBP5434238.1 TIGR03960 family B12-binding radical SAM protein [bacterium]
MKLITSFLRRIEKPGRYFAPFIETVKVKTDPNKPKVLILFPDLFEMAQSHTGVKILYSLFNRRGFLVDFGFSPQKDVFEEAKASGGLTSMMHGVNYRDFDIIAVSFQYQLQYPDFLKIMDIAGIPIHSKDRINSSDYPIIWSGGPVMCNPEPMADFIDMVSIGEFEPYAEEFMDMLENIKEKQKRIEAFSKIPAIYIPSKHDENSVKINPDGSLSGIEARRAVLKDLNYDPDSLFDAPIFAMRTIHDRFTIEIMRGCTRGCRFCMAGMFYRPHREKSAENVCEILDRVVRTSGYDEAGFLSLSAADHSEIEDILVRSYSRYSRKISVSLPSLRTETITPKIAQAIRKGRKVGFTLAVESGSDRLRKMINKGNSEEDLLNALNTIFSNGWQAVKLYFMLGLPHEEEEDLFETVELVKKMCNYVKRFGKKAMISASFSTFVPQPFTPFQWEKMSSPAEIKAKQKIIIDNLRGIRNLKLSWHDQEISTVEGYLSRAGREYGKVIEFVAKNMKGLQTEDESFDPALWDEGLAYAGIDPESTYLEKPLDKPLPYEHIDLRIDRRFLLKEREKAFNFQETPDCAKTGICNKCGACDFKEIRPLKFTGKALDENETFEIPEKSNKTNSFPYVFSLSKHGNSISVGHLDLVSFLFKALSLADLKVLYSDGFHPMPRFNLAFPAPVGVEVDEEFGSVWLTEEVNEAETLEKLNSILENSGIEFLSFKLIEREHIKEVEKYLRTLPVHSYTVKFYDAADYRKMKPQLSVLESNEDTLELTFEHIAELGGVMKCFAGIEGDFHVRKLSYRERLRESSALMHSIF